MIAAHQPDAQRDDVTLAAFRRHWLDVHGPLVCGFPALRHYVQDHVIASPAMNAPAHDMRIDGFPILWFDNDADRQRAHVSPKMAACTVDSRSFIGAVSRVICEPRIVLPEAGTEARMKLIAVLPGQAADDAALERYAAWARNLPGLPAWCCIACCSGGRTEQHHPASAGEHCRACRTGIPSLVDLECAVVGDDTDAAHFAVEEHRLV